MAVTFKSRITKPDIPLDTPEPPAALSTPPPAPPAESDVVVIPMEHVAPVKGGKPTPENDCLLALAAWSTGMKVGTVMLVHRENGSGYEVVRAEPDPQVEGTWRLVIMGANGVEGQPRFTQRENGLYRPVWR